ncbi:MAG: hypothetical protein NTY38_18000, partial [Acidobacteria bacterium]|nr:hypothetical protein [Acidobacteriota bacterium]
MTRRTHFLLFASILAFGAQLFAERIPNRYIVEFKTESVARKLGRRLAREGAHGAAANSHRSRVRAEQQQARRQLSTDATVLDSIDTVANALFVEIPDAKTSQLAALPNVRSIHPMRTFHMVLDRAVEVNKVADAWNQVGVDRAGAGIKIAIIDSGIDSGHAAFQDPSLTIPASYPKLT